MKLIIIIPAYNEALVIREVIKSIPTTFQGIDKFEIVVVDDKSSDSTAGVAKQAGAMVLRHRLNLGVGGATITGLKYARLHKFDIVATMDADGQHDGRELPKLIEKVLAGHNFVIGSRLLERSTEGMPFIKKAGNKIFTLITFLFYRVWVSDSQSGFRAFSGLALEKCQPTNVGYEICTEMIGKAKEAGLKIVEVPIKTIYTEYSKRKGQYYLNGFNIIIKLALNKLKGSL